MNKLGSRLSEKRIDELASRSEEIIQGAGHRKRENRLSNMETVGLPNLTERESGEWIK